MAMLKPTITTSTVVVMTGMPIMTNNGGMKGVITFSSSGAKSKLGDIPIRIVRSELNWEDGMEKRKRICQKLLHWTVLRQRRRSGFLSVLSMILTRRSERDSKPFVRPGQLPRSSTRWFKSFCRWFVNEEASTLRIGWQRYVPVLLQHCTVLPMELSGIKQLS